MIGDHFGISAQSAHEMVMKGLKATLAEPAAELRALAVECLDYMLAAIWPAATKGDLQAQAGEQKQRHFAEPFEIGTIDDRAALPLTTDKTGARQNRQVRRHRILRNPHEARQLAGGHAVRLATHEQPKCIEARRLGQRRQA
jgi:hypothetical protein